VFINASTEYNLAYFIATPELINILNVSSIYLAIRLSIRIQQISQVQNNCGRLFCIDLQIMEWRTWMIAPARQFMFTSNAFLIVLTV